MKPGQVFAQLLILQFSGIGGTFSQFALATPLFGSIVFLFGGADDDAPPLSSLDSALNVIPLPIFFIFLNEKLQFLTIH